MVVPPNTPTCRIRATIRGVEFEDEQSWGEDESLLPPGVMAGTTSPARYRLTALIEEVSSVEEPRGAETCEERYAPGSEDILFIYRTNVREGDSFEEGQTVEGQVWNGYLRSYTLEDRKG